MRSFTDIFIRHPVLAVVVNLILALAGWRALSALPLQQYPQIESTSVLITTVYTGASAETVRGFLTTPIERAVSAIGGVDHVNGQAHERAAHDPPIGQRARQIGGSRGRGARRERDGRPFRVLRLE